MKDLWQLRNPSPGYESLYLTATSPAGDRALWLRHTWLNGDPVLWVTWWGPDLVQSRGPGTAELLAGGTRGELDGHTWDISWTAQADPIRYAPKALYDRRFPRSNGAVLVPHGHVDGTFNGEVLAGWSVVVGHNWGREHAYEWEWSHGADGADWFDQLRARPFRGCPWLTVATTHLDGVTLASRRPLPVSITAAEEVHWDYASPDGPPRQVRNCSVARAVLERRSFRATVEHGGP